jgi:hypothetical protein
MGVCGWFGMKGGFDPIGRGEVNGTLPDVMQ